MTIRNKAIITLAIGTGILMASSIFFTTRLFGQKMDQLDIQKAKLDTERVGEAINSEIDNLNNKTADWPIWDDSYKFIQDRNNEYIISNLDNSASFESLRINFMIFTNLENKIIYEKGFNQETKKQDKVPQGLYKYISKLDTENYSGMIILPEGLFLISSRPILPSSFEGPSKGTIIFGRRFDTVEIENISKITKQSEIQVLPIGNLKINETDTHVVDENNLEGRGLVKDVFGSLLHITV